MTEKTHTSPAPPSPGDGIWPNETPNQVQRHYRPAIHPDVVGHPGFGYRTEEVEGVLIERDVMVPLRDGTRLYADVYRVAGELVPAIVCYSPFGKHPHIDLGLFDGAEFPVDKLSEHTPFEVFDPIRWAKEGFAICVVDGVGNWHSEGTAQFFDQQEALAGYDTVEHFAGLEWCNGKVGWGAVSYFAMTAWSVAALNPPHLAAILTWDAASDTYRETNHHGGIPSTLTHNWMLLTGVGLGQVEDMEATQSEHPLFDEWWQLRVADWSKITVPTYSITEWGNDIHLRGTVQAWREVAAPQKYLDITGGKEWAEFYSDWAFERQRAFLGQFLRAESNGVDDWAPVRIGIRTGGDTWEFREELAFPLERTKYRNYHLDARGASAGHEQVEEEASVSYDSTRQGDGAEFIIRFEEPTEVTGYSKVRFWVSADLHNDADLFVAFERVRPSGEVVPHIFSQMWNEGPAAFGWLRASHRELDPEKSTEWQPYHRHQRRQWLVHGTPVPVDIEVWPTNIMFEAGDSLRILVRGTLIHPDPNAPMATNYMTRNLGRHIIHTGGKYDSRVVLPLIPSSH
ncbi:putative acyl esterase [Arthrobacter bambusae]|uniref:Acyl esterase n=1 Tax=Arthrobacter bambusae TaxID=1338426 RepID=A0ABV2P0V7_9MICC